MSRTIVIGDVHGCGIELQNLLEQEIKVQPEDTVYLVGDLFDRGLYAYLVWQLIEKYNLKCILGNHEVRILQHIRGTRPHLSPFYYTAIDDLRNNGVGDEELANFILERPRLVVLEDKKVIITHGGVVPNDPTKEHESANTYGNYKDRKTPIPRDGETIVEEYWWDLYKGDYLILYGHFATPIEDTRPRLRHNSIGLDTACVHGGPLTAYCIETGEYFTYESGIDWLQKLKDNMGTERWDELSQQLNNYLNETRL